MGHYDTDYAWTAQAKLNRRNQEIVAAARNNLVYILQLLKDLDNTSISKRHLNALEDLKNEQIVKSNIENL